MKNVLLLICLGLGFFAKAQTPTWSDDVACIMYSHCTPCHNQNGIAPFSLLEYSDAVANASSIEAAVDSGEMPPWQPDNSYSFLAHDYSLSANEIAILKNWIQSGTPEGTPANAPQQPVYGNNGQLPNPDYSSRIPAYTSTAASQDVYRYFALSNPNTIDQFITEWEVVPGNPGIVHHVLVYIDPTGNALTTDANDPLPGYAASGTSTNNFSLIGVWAPGEQKYVTPQGFGLKLPANSAIVLQIHYPTGSDGQLDSTILKLKYATTPVREIYLSAPSGPQAMISNFNSSIQNGPFYVMPNTTKTFNAKFILNSDKTFFSAAPHMHLVGKSMTVYTVRPGNDTVPMVRINDWDFHWQGSYYFRQPIKVPATSVLWTHAFYDNTSANTQNPNYANPQLVIGGEATTDEMMMVFVAYSDYMTGDENMIIDNNAHYPHHQSCTPLLGIDKPKSSIKLSVFPNPSTDKVQIFTEKDLHSVELLSINGQKIMKWNAEHSNSMELDLTWLPKGCYMIRVEDNNGSQASEILQIN